MFCVGRVTVPPTGSEAKLSSLCPFPNPHLPPRSSVTLRAPMPSAPLTSHRSSGKWASALLKPVHDPFSRLLPSGFFSRSPSTEVPEGRSDCAASLAGGCGATGSIVIGFGSPAPALRSPARLDNHSASCSWACSPPCLLPFLPSFPSSCLSPSPYGAATC